MKRVVVIVLDGCGAGAAPDHAKFGDGPDVATIKNVWNHVGGFHAPTLERIGFLAACGIETTKPEGKWGRAMELSQGKDSVTGHWEMMGVVTEEPFPTYPNGFPAEVVEAFEQKIGRKVLANVPASGTAIIEKFGPEHTTTGSPILYTSADSVFQIACHTDVVPIEQLYEWCAIAREMLVAPHNVQRVIARPFIGTPGAYQRTSQRKDFPVVPPHNLIDEIGDVYGVGVVPELFAGRGFREVERSQSNAQHARAFEEAWESDARFIFANFEDFDMLYGHRNDPEGFARCLEEFDSWLGAWFAPTPKNSLWIITADHGNDPTDASTDHSREYVPVAIWGAGTGSFGDRRGMMSIGGTVAKALGIPHELAKKSLL